MKKVLVVFLILALVLSGCAWNGAGAQESQPSEDAAPSHRDESQNTEQIPVPDDPEEPAGDPEKEPEKEPEPEGYLQQILWAGFMVFEEPSYDAAPVQPLPVGTYTIVDEAQDDEDLTWGRLKSGLGWICLTDIREFDGPVSIGGADEEIHGKAVFAYMYEDAPGTVPVVIHACEDLTKVELYTCRMGDIRMEPDELIFEELEMAKGEFLVVLLSFPGDFSVYEIQLTDSDGMLRRYQINMSGRNGTVFAWEITE